MISLTVYYKNKLINQNKKFKKASEGSILGKRTFKEAFGYDNDYEVVQEPNKENCKIINGINWIDSYTENLYNKKS